MSIGNYEELIKKVEEIKKDTQIDLSTEEDLAVAIMNLISLEEHFFFTANKTGNDEYFETLKLIREMRKKFLGMMIKQYEGEVWCISKHLLAASMRLLEVGTKMQSKDQFDTAKEMFDNAYRLFSLFFSLRLKMSTLPPKKEVDPNKAWTKDDIMNELINCCKE